MNKLMYQFVATTKKKKKKEIDPFVDTVCPLRVSRVIIKMSCLWKIYEVLAANKLFFSKL